MSESGSTAVQRFSAKLERRSTLVLAITAVVGLTVVLAMLEGVLALLLRVPQWLPNGFVLEGVRSIYLREDVSIPQMDLNIVGYDPDLTYLLRSRPARFKNVEFDTTIAGNSAGLRDDEASLDRPELVVLGDSFTLGWGVERDDTYAQILERSTGLKVLNAAMSSYGTARQILLLERLDLSATRVVILQYFMNDYRENRAFVDSGNSLAITPEDEFLRTVRDYERQATYRPLDYLAAFLDRRPYFPELQGVTSREIAEAFLRVVVDSEELQDLQILCFEIDPWDRFAGFRIAGVLPELLETEPEFSDLRQRLTFLPLDGVFEEEDFFRLDPHLRPSGHRKLAVEVEEALADLGATELVASEKPNS